MKKIKIFLSYKTRRVALTSTILTPIQTGRAIANEIFEEMIGDDTGENISHLNENYSEITAIYWAWKNYKKIGNPDYIGFMHNRRHILFNDNNIPIAYSPKTDEDIMNVCSEYDVIVPNPFRLGETVYEQYKKYHYIKDYDIAIETIKRKYPEYSQTLDEFNDQYIAHFCNIFIFKKEIFKEYCKWLFDILFEIQDKIDLRNRDKYQIRVHGFIAERLTALFIYNLIRKNYKVKSLPLLQYN